MPASPSPTQGAPLRQTTFRALLDALAVQGRAHPPLVAVPSTASIKDALAVLAKHQILSVPVVSPRAASTSGAGIAAAGRQYICLLSVVDLLGAVVGASTAKSGRPRTPWGSRSPADRAAALSQPVDLAMPLDNAREAYRVWERDIDDTLDDTLRSGFAKAVHRALLTSVADGPTAPAKLVTQSDIVRYVVARPESVTPGAVDLDKTVADLALGQLPKDRTLVTIGPNVTALDAFQAMWNAGVQAVPIVDADGALVAAMSAAALRGLTAANVDALDLPVLEFLKAQNHGQLPAVATCTPTTPLRDVITAIVQGALHRVYLTTADDASGKRKCLGVITLTDLIRLFVA
ncbi:hypothetical protein AMAG_10295 [Allomyces macrogynus ATCC 38327]|uniref:CBS domain-containing protein n=1 Tax=Allomyces macrogynus (strain ATCC 38327) TaxID=578462 RepID=A0A0L0SU00_ALLM3|nr:hypothetical protein AMAG_10295 [Allomyces macrogynus ATCC 38327]|eukprot:KNE66018.1 hypothetical protein AMAG_10295 [Allomyces macrogynus ATCC 38327]